MKAVREIFLLVSLTLLPVFAFSQSGSSQPSVKPSPTPRSDLGFGKRLIRDEKAIWSAPFHLKKDDTRWLVPLAATTMGLIIADRHLSAVVDRNGSLQPISHKVSLLGSAYGVVGTTAAFYLIGRASNDQHAVQTGKLLGEALIGATVVTEILKLATERSRPNSGSGRGRFFTHGNAFPSGHTSSSWAVATVLAMQYKHSRWIKYGAFFAATAVGLSRYSGRNHFLSDILTGGAIGYGVGRFVYNNR